MSRRFSLFASLLLLLAATGCSALGGGRTLTGITPTSYVSKRVGSQIIYADFAADANSPSMVEFATER
jgi:hypothetical protein